MDNAAGADGREDASLSAPSVVRCPLLLNPLSERGRLSRVVPWLGTTALVSLVTLGLSATGLFNSRVGQLIGVVLIALVFLGSVVLTVVPAMRRGPELKPELEVDRRELRLRDPKTGLVLAAAPRSAITLTRGMSKRGGDNGDYEHPVLAIRMPGWEELTLGVHDMSLAWRDAALYLPAPYYIVGPPEWSALVEILDLRPLLLVRDDIPA